MDALYEMGLSRQPCAEDTMPSGLVEPLHEFHRQQVSYCFWKISRRLPAVLAGAGDIDLLVARSDLHCAQVMLADRAFKLFPAVADRDHPAAMSSLGCDERSGQLIHICLHSQLRGAAS